MTGIAKGFKPAQFSAGFLDLSGPYYLRRDDASCAVGLLVLNSHANYIDVAHGGVLATFADVAMSFAVHCSERPQLMIASVTLTTNFLAGAKVGDWLEARCRIDRKGKRLAYTSGEICRDDEVLITMTGVYSIIRKA